MGGPWDAWRAYFRGSACATVGCGPSAGTLWACEKQCKPTPTPVALPTHLQPGVASAEVVASWTDFSKSPYLREQKVIFHPGEVSPLGGCAQSCRPS